MNTYTASGLSLTRGVDQPSLLARVGDLVTAFARRIAEMPARRAAMNELSMLSDHELADIGMTRGDIRRVYDPAFTAMRANARVGSYGTRLVG